MRAPSTPAPEQEEEEEEEEDDEEAEEEAEEEEKEQEEVKGFGLFDQAQAPCLWPTLNTASLCVAKHSLDAAVWFSCVLVIVQDEHGVPWRE